MTYKPSSEYNCWSQFKQRCLNPKSRSYCNYGARGITVAPEWINDFAAFLAYVGPKPSPEYSLERMDNDRGYEPGNVCWATWLEQANNRREYGTGATNTPFVKGTKVTNTKHGMTDSQEYGSWSAMKDRCLNSKGSNYPRWGGRGITIYEPWIHDFSAFYDYIGPKPTPKHSLDRIDNNAGYFPGNVRWATRMEQRHNQRPHPTGSAHGNYEHGHTRTKTYHIWGGTKTRCFNPKSDRYCTYGGVGITMCKRWKDDFEAFLADLGPAPSRQVLVRLNRDGNYSCGKCSECRKKSWSLNCKWASLDESNQTRRPSSRSGKLDVEKVLQIRQQLKAGRTHAQVAAEFGVGYSLVGKIGRRENWKTV